MGASKQIDPVSRVQEVPKKHNSVSNLTTKQAVLLAKKEIKRGNILKAQQLYNAVLQQEARHPVAKKGLRNLQKELLPKSSSGAVAVNPPKEQVNAVGRLLQSGQFKKA